MSEEPLRTDNGGGKPAVSPRFTREHRRRRFRRHRRRAMIRSIYALPSLATLGNAICGFAAIYIAALSGSSDWLGAWFAQPEHRFASAAVFIFVAMIFDALDGRLARFTRHTTDFGGQLDSLADAVSFGVAPAFIAIQFFKANTKDMQLDPMLTRGIWAAGALYMSCAVMRLARFNVSNQHGEQHHFSFFGLPSPGAAGAVAAIILLHQDFEWRRTSPALENLTMWLTPVIVLITGLLMVSTIRYSHLVNRYLRGKKSMPVVLVTLVLVLLLIVRPTYTFAGLVLVYAFSGLASWLYAKVRRRAGLTTAPVAALPQKVEHP